MARTKKTSTVITGSRHRHAGMTAIKPDLDLGNGYSASTYETEINETETILEKYNEKLSEIDGLRNEFLVKEKNLSETSKRILNAVAAIYGKDSIEYEKVGGVRTSLIKHHKKTKAA